MKRLFAATVMTVAMMAGGNVWAGDEMAEEYMEPQLHSSMAGASNPCPHYAGSCRDRVSGWLAHMDAMAEDAEGAMRADTYAYGYRMSRGESTAAHREAVAAAMAAAMAEELPEPSEADLAKIGIAAFLEAAMMHQEAAMEGG